MTPSPAPDDAPAFVYAIGRVNQGVRRELTRRLAAWELTVPLYTTLSVLQRRPGLSNAQLARRALITPQAMTEVMSELERRDLVRRRADPSHGRILRATLTPRGATTLAEVEAVVEQLHEMLLADVAETDRAVVVAGLTTVMQTLSGWSARD